MRFFVIGLSHHTAEVAIREHFAIDDVRLPEKLKAFKETACAEEAMILSTCNRFECYFCANNSDAGMTWLLEKTNLLADLKDHLYCYEGKEAVAHLFRVACGLDSMMLGETQILKQIKTAFEAACQIQADGKWLRSVYQATLAAAKQIRHQTQIDQHSMSIPVSIVNLAKTTLSDLEKASVLFIGAGEMIGACLTHFSSGQFQSMTIANRSLPAAETLAKPVGADAMLLSDLTAEKLARFDIVISCTASSTPLLSKRMVDVAMKFRNHRPVLMVDLAVPRDISPSVSNLPHIALFSIDDLGEIVQKGKQKRKQAAWMAESMIAHRVDEFANWWKHRRHVPLICALHNQAEITGQAEIERALRELTQGKPAEQVLTQLTQRLTNRLLHVPMQALHDAEQDDSVAIRLAAGYSVDYPDSTTLLSSSVSL